MIWRPSQDGRFSIKRAYDLKMYRIEEPEGEPQEENETQQYGKFYRNSKSLEL